MSRRRRESLLHIGRLRWWLAVLMLVALPSWATFQARERLVLDGQQVELLVLPLTPWLDAHPHAMPESSVTSTNNWRGYLGYWEVRDDRLWLTKVTQTVLGPPRKVKLSRLVSSPDGGAEFSNEETEQELSMPEDHDITSVLFGKPKPVLATWFSGTLVTVRDEAICLKRYRSDEPCFLVLWVDKGQVGRRVELDLAQFEQFQCDRFAAYKQTPDYAERLREFTESAGDDAEGWVYGSAAPYYLALEGAASTPLDAAACRRLRD